MARLTDLLINAVAPLLIGIALYFAGIYFTFPAFIKNYLADGLWAYAFISCMLIVWSRNMNILWVLAAFLTTVAFETLQYFQLLQGTGDIADVLVYFISFSAALIINQFIKKHLYQNPKQHAFN